MTNCHGLKMTAADGKRRVTDVPDNYIARCFVLLGYVDGDYPGEKPRKAGRWRIVESGG